MRRSIMFVVCLAPMICSAGQMTVFENTSSNRLICYEVLESSTGKVIADIPGNTQMKVLDIADKRVACQYALQSGSTFLSFVDVQLGDIYRFTLGRVPLGSSTRDAVLVNGKPDSILSKETAKNIQGARVGAYEAKKREEEAAEAAEARRKKIIAEFRKKLAPGDESSDGVIIEVKGNLIKVQTNQSQCSQRSYDGSCMNYVNTPVEKWFKRSQLYPQ